MNNLDFVTNGRKIYTLAGNDWYAVEQNDSKVMLVDTDGKVAGEELRTPWSYAKSCYEKTATNGQCVLDYINNIAEQYFSSIKYAIIPRNINCLNKQNVGDGELKNAYMWAMSYEEIIQNKKVSDILVRNVEECIWTRTFSETYFQCNCALSMCISNASLSSSSDSVTIKLAVAPAFYLDKSAIKSISKNGEIILK